MKIRIGDVVRFRRRGPKMVVIKVFDDFAHCCWFDYRINDFSDVMYPVSGLVMIPQFYRANREGR